MKYVELVQQVAQHSGLTPKQVREVLSNTANVLVAMDVDEKVRTPFGVFRVATLKARVMTPPGSFLQFNVPEVHVVRLKPGVRLRKA